MLEVLVDSVTEAEKLVQQAAAIVTNLKVLADGFDGNCVALPENMQQGQQQSAHAYHLGDSIWGHIHRHVRERERTGIPVAGLGKSSSFSEILCELGRTLECQSELERWENEGGQ